MDPTQNLISHIAFSEKWVAGVSGLLNKLRVQFEKNK